MTVRPERLAGGYRRTTTVGEPDGMSAAGVGAPSGPIAKTVMRSDTSLATNSRLPTARI